MDTLKTDPRVIFPNLLALRDWEGASRLGEIDVPTLVCSGEADHRANLTEADRMAEAIRGADRKTLDQAGHMLPTEQPAALASTVREFLGALS